MRQLHLGQRGSANWPFILSLLLLLVFVYLWYSQRDDLDNAVRERDAAVAESGEYQQVAQEIARYASDLSSRVGWNTEIAKDVIANAPASIQQKANTLPGVQDYYFTDLEKLTAHLEPQGMVPGENGGPGLLSRLINDAQVQIEAEIRRASAEGVAEKAIDFEELTPELRNKLREVSRMTVPTPPQQPRDDDDEAAAEEYRRKLAEYERKVQEWNAAINELQQLEGFEKVADTVASLGRLDLESMQPILLEMFDNPPDKQVTIADLVTYPPMIIERFKNEFKGNKAEDQAVIARLQEEIRTKDTSISELQQQLEEEQNRRAQEVAQLQGEVAQANEIAEANRRDATTAMSDLARVTEDSQAVVTQKDMAIGALEERIRIDKEKRDLEIRRDDPDGRILASSPMMQTAVIDLGTSAKVYPGLKFRVSRIGRGGIRETVGQVQVIRTVGPNSAKVAVTSLANPRDPIIQGDIISNPFFKATGPIYITLAGEMQSYPIEVLRSRLDRMGVIIDDAPSGRTDYIVVPDEMAAPSDMGGGGEDEDMEEDEEPAGAKSAFERIQSQARNIGATVITERMLKEFLGL